MNTQKLLVAGFLALSLAAAAAKAAILPGSDIGGLNINGSQPGDLAIGFRNAASASDFVVDIGQFTAYEGVAPGTYTIAGFNTSELASVFSNAFTTSGTFWTVFGGAGQEGLTAPNNTIWATSNSTLSRQSVGIQGNLSIPLDGFVNTGLGSSSFGGASNANVLSPKTFTNLGSSTSYSGFFGSPVESTTVGSTSLNLWELTPGSGAGVLLGRFDLSNAGLTFTVIPEPSTYAMILGVATLGFAAIRRRKQAQLLA